MTKKDLENIICKYNSAESEVVELDSRFGICLYNSSNENSAIASDKVNF